MATVRLKIPVIAIPTKVESKPLYHLRPLFTGYPTASNRRLEIATARLRDEIKQFFKGFELDRNNVSQLLWYLFDPPTQYHVFDCNFRTGNIWVEGKFGVVTFELQNITFACLPHLNYYMFIIQSGKANRAVIERRTEQVIKKLLPNFKKELKDIFTVQQYYVTGRELLTHVEVSVNIGFGEFQYENDLPGWLFARLRDDTYFDGAMEIERIGSDLNSRYPAELGRAFHRDELVDKIYQIIFQKENTPLAIVGNEGVGKRSLVHEAVWRYQSNYYKRRRGEPEIVWQLDPTRVISGMSIVGMWQKRFEAIINYLIDPFEDGSKSYKLLIDNPVALLRVGKSAQNNMTLSDVLKSYLEKRTLQVILVATPEEWKIVQEKDRSFADLFQVFRIPEPDLETTTRIVLLQRNLLERENGCSFTI
ncbi:MAG: ATP-dependent Clp protease ATP-binding subunit, partial [Saprospiraceae bacterium]